MKHLSSFLKSTVFFLLFILFALSLLSYNSADISFLNYPKNVAITNIIGVVGAYIGFFLFSIFGYAAYFFPFYFVGLGLDKLGFFRFSGLAKSKLISTLSLIFFIVFLSGFIGLFFPGDTEMFRASPLFHLRTL